MSNTLLESLWARVDTNIGSRIKQISDLLTQALSANTESTSARDTAVAAEQTASTAAANAASSESVAKSAETAASGYAETAQTSATEAVDAKNRAVEIAGGDFATLEYVDNTVADAIRVDTTVGSRVFAGDIMVYGNSGIRSIPHVATGLDTSQKSHHGMWIIREGNTVTLWGAGYSIGALHLTEILPSGFRPAQGHYVANAGTAAGEGVSYILGHHHSWTRLTFSYGTPPVGVHLAIQARWVTDDPWPATLPGTPG